MNDLELRQLHCLVVLAEELNFGRAAARLHLSQPPLTRLLLEVERSVGARLFERTTRQVRLTPVGEIFIREAQAVIARADQARETVLAAVRRQSGQLRLAYTPLALQTVLPRVIAALRERDHEVRIDLVELPGGAQTEPLRAGHVDAGFADGPLEIDGFVSRLLHQEALEVLLPADHRLSLRESLALEDLAEETLILHPRHEYPGHYDAVVTACGDAGFVPRVYHREARQNCLALVTAGQGLLLTSRSHSQTPPAGLRSVSLAAPESLRSEVWAVLPVAHGAPSVEALRHALSSSA
ncbi:MAG: LysR family transcriptional regulator [Armatimonadota bacterium]